MDARKHRFGPADLEELFAGASKLVAAKRGKLVTFDLADGVPVGDRAFLGAVLGPSGYLRAPAIRRGKTWLVGFHPEGFASVLG